LGSVGNEGLQRLCNWAHRGGEATAAKILFEKTVASRLDLTAYHRVRVALQLDSAKEAQFSLTRGRTVRQHAESESRRDCPVPVRPANSAFRQLRHCFGFSKPLAAQKACSHGCQANRCLQAAHSRISARAVRLRLRRQAKQCLGVVSNPISLKNCWDLRENTKVFAHFEH